ncbi:hypothetical protein SK128_024831, partial [Halocaridina rubra]
ADGRVEPYELVELFYGSSSVSPATHASQLSPRSAGTSSPEIMQVLEQSSKDKHPDSYTCEVCGRLFREASHFTKHKRGALCRKLAQRLAKKNKKRKGTGNESLDRKKQTILHKPYQCNVCGAKFCDKVNVELHIERRHHTKQQLWVEIAKNGGFSCAECDRWFQDKAELIDHHSQHRQTYGHQNDRLNHPGDRVPMSERALTQQPQNAAVAYYHDALHHVQNYGQQPQPSHLPPPPPPPVAHMHPNIAAMLHTPQITPVALVPNSQTNSQPVMSPLTPIPEVPLLGVDTVAKVAKHNKPDRLATGNKWNICGDCGLKFVDPMNLEIHIQRKHTDSYMVETVNLGYGAILYKTNNTRSDIQCILNQNGTSIPDTKPNKTNPQTFDCILCGFKATTKNHILYHLQNIHNTNNTNFIHVLETLDCGKKNSRGHKLKKGSQDPLLRVQKHTCEACKEVFLSKAELIRHRIKDKQYMCNVCCHSSCSQQQITAHMDTHNLLVVENEQNSVCSGILCWICGHVLASASALDGHIGDHDSRISVECIYCGERSRRLNHLIPHLLNNHPRQSHRVKVTLTRPDHTTAFYFVKVFQDGSLEEDSDPHPPSSVAVTASSSNTGISTSSIVISAHFPPAYACSECGACLAGAAQLEAHLQVHQSCAVTTDTSTSSSNDTFTNSVASMIPAPQAIGMMPGSVDKVPGSIEFRCEECGFWRQESEPVMRHIQAVHMSGNMLHSVKLQSGVIQVHPIHVVTPISSLSTQ